MTSSPSSGPVRLRLGRAADAQAVLDLSESVAAEGRWIGRESPTDRERGLTMYLSSLDSPSHLPLLAVADKADYEDDDQAGAERLIGHLHLGVAPYGVAELGMLVAADWRGQGVGSRLMDEAIAWARAHPDVHKVALQVWPHNAAAIGLYERHGFQREGYLVKHYRRRSGELWDAVVMGLRLEP